MQQNTFYNMYTQNEFQVKFRVDSQFDDVSSFKAKNPGLFKNVLSLPVDQAQSQYLSSLKKFKCYIKLDQRTYIPKYTQQFNRQEQSKPTPTFYDLILQLDSVFKEALKKITEQEEKKDLDIWLLQSEKPVFVFYIQKKRESSLDLYLITMLSQQQFKGQ